MPPQLLEQQRELILQSLIENKLREHEMNRLAYRLPARKSTKW